MTNLLVAAVVVLTVAVGANLLLTLALARKVRAISPAAFPHPPEPTLLPVGASVPEFSTLTTSGDECNQAALLSGTQLVAFFSTTCSSCRPAIPDFVRRAASLGSGVAFVVSDGNRDAEHALCEALASVQTVAVVGSDSHVLRAFETNGFPLFVLFDDGVVTAAGHSMHEIPELVAHDPAR